VTEPAIFARGLVKTFGDTRVLDGIDLAVPPGTIFGLLGPNGAGKTTLLRILLGIIDPDAGERRLLGHTAPLKAAREVGYLPEERGLYPAMKPRDAIAFMGALRGLPLAIGRARADEMLVAHGLGDAAGRPIRSLSKGMAQTVQILGTLVHQPRLIVLDEPFAGLDALNQGRLEALVRAQAAAGVSVIFSTHVIAHAERLCERVAILVRGRIRFDGAVEAARGRLRPHVRLGTRAKSGPWRAAIPADAVHEEGVWRFELPPGGVEPLLEALIAGGAGIETLSIERPGLHEAFVAIAGEDATLAAAQGPTGEVAR
jgi:ABC-2 type transport system ATP-binding protein